VNEHIVTLLVMIARGKTVHITAVAILSYCVEAGLPGAGAAAEPAAAAAAAAAVAPAPISRMQAMAFAVKVPWRTYELARLQIGGPSMPTRRSLRPDIDRLVPLARIVQDHGEDGASVHVSLKDFVGYDLEQFPWLRQLDELWIKIGCDGATDLGEKNEVIRFNTAMDFAYANAGPLMPSESNVDG